MSWLGFNFSLPSTPLARSPSPLVFHQPNSQSYELEGKSDGVTALDKTCTVFRFLLEQEPKAPSCLQVPGGVCPLPPHLHPTSPCTTHASPHVVKHTCNTLHLEPSALAYPAPGAHFSRVSSSHAPSPPVRLCPEVIFCNFLKIPPYLFIYLNIFIGVYLLYNDVLVSAVWKLPQPRHSLFLFPAVFLSTARTPSNILYILNFNFCQSSSSRI